MSDVGRLEPFSPDNIAGAWWLGGCSVIPIKPGGQKKPQFKWDAYQRTRATAAQVDEWFNGMYRHSGVAVICGEVSGNLEMLELEGRAYNHESLTKIEDACREAGVLDLWNQLRTEGYSETTPSGGLHLLYRVADHPVPGNRKLASRPAFEDEYTDEEIKIGLQNPGFVARRVLAETRGEGGYVVVAPSAGHVHSSGRPWQTVSGIQGQFLTITQEQRLKLHGAITAALDVPAAKNLPAVAERPKAPAPLPGVLRPGDDFDQTHDWEEPWFTDQGWKVHHREGAETFWTRPGKDLADGHSASTGYSDDGVDRLFIWTTSTDLPAEEPLTKFRVLVHYHFGGDFSRAASALRQNCAFGCDKPHGSQFSGYAMRPLVFDEDGNQVEVSRVDGEPRLHDLDNTEQMRLPGGGVLFTDVGYAARIYDKCASTARFNAVEKAWYVWHPGASAWAPDDYGQIPQLVEAEVVQVVEHMKQTMFHAEEGEGKEAARLYEEARRALSHGRITAITSRFKEHPGITVMPEEFDCNLDLLNLSNCVYNMATGQTMQHSPNLMLTNTFGADFDPDAKCPKWDKFIHDVLPDVSVRTYVQRAMGYSLLGRPVERVMFLLHGPSGTGKSVLTDVMTRLFGTYGAAAPASTFRLKKNEATVDLHQLRGKRYVATSELPDGVQLDEDLLKRISGNDLIRSRALYESYHSWRAQCVVWIATNFLPRLSGDDNAIWRRARTIPMRTEFGPNGKTEIKGLADQLLKERNGILNWLLDGLAEYRLRGLDEPEAVITDLATYRNEMDSVSSWFNESLHDGIWSLDPNGSVSGRTLYEHYHSFCRDQGFTPLGRVRFTKRVSGVIPGIESKKSNGQMVWQGVKRGSDGS